MSLREGDDSLSKTTVEHVRCNLCGADDARLYLEQEDRRYRDTPRDIWRLVRCGKCGLIYLNPRPTAEGMQAFYPAAFYDGLDGPRAERGAGERRPRRRAGVSALRDRMALREKAGIVTRCSRRPGRLIDVGPGRGGFLRAMKDRGWSVVGVDISADMCAYIRARHAIECMHSDFARLTPPVDSMDVVTFWASFEHQRDPARALDVCREMLVPGGVVVILVPNARSIEERLLRRVDPNPVDVPRHLFHFSEETLRLMLERKGFAVSTVRHFTVNAYDRLSVIASAAAARVPARNIVGKTSRFLLETAGFAAGDAAASVFAAAGRSHSIVVIARKL